MAQMTTKRAGKSGSRGGTRSASRAVNRSRANSPRSKSVKSMNGRRSTRRAPSGSRRKSAGRISGTAPYSLGAKSKSINGRVRAVARRGVGAVARNAKGLGAVGRAASRAKGVAAVGAAGLAGLAGGIALDRWNNSYSRTQAFARNRRAARSG
jgi:hypothetical protein